MLGGFEKMAANLLPLRELIDLLKLVLFKGLTRLRIVLPLTAFSLDNDSKSLTIYN